MQEIQELKNKYGQDAEHIIASGLGLVKVGSKYRCPNGYAHKHNDRSPSMSWDPQALHFYCFGCDNKIDIYGYYKDHLNYTHAEIMRDVAGIEQKRNVFADEARKVKDIFTDDKCVEYLTKLRGLTEETIKTLKLGVYNGQIAFPYYKNETLVGYKLRKPLKDPGQPKMTSLKGSKPYLFNAVNIDINNKELIICEGEIDCGILVQCGFTNSVSVGAGANSVKQVCEQAEDFFKYFDTIIIASDNDEAGKEMDRAFTEILKDKVKVIDKKLYKYNDINEEHYIFGKDKIKELIESARFKVEGRRDLERDPYRGLQARSGKYIPTGLTDIDNAINDLEPGRLTLLGGRANGGKTTVVKQIIANAINKGNKVYLMNGENEAESLLNDFYQIVVGRKRELYDTIKINKKYKKEPKPEVLKKLQKWHNKKLYMFNKGESKLKTLPQLLKMLEEEIKYNQHDLVIIDNMMSILSVNAAEKYEQQADFVQALCDLAKNYNTHIILVLHPNKTYVKGQDMDFEQISGSSDIYNKADVVIAVVREYDEESNAQMISGYVQVIKNRYYSELPKIMTWFDPETGLLLQRDDNGELHQYIFNWDNNRPQDEEGLPF